MIRRLLTPAQCRAARALLGWTQAGLADKAGIARRTVAHFEVGRRALLARTRQDIMVAFEQAGIEFVWAVATGGEGVRVAEREALQSRPDVQPGAVRSL